MGDLKRLEDTIGTKWLRVTKETISDQTSMNLANTMIAVDVTIRFGKATRHPDRSRQCNDRKIHPSEQDAVDVLTRAYVPVDRNLAEEGPRSTMRKEPFANRTSRGESEYHTESDLLLDNSEEKKEDLYYRSLDDFVLYNSRGIIFLWVAQFGANSD